jgi:hypothetical protein
MVFVFVPPAGHDGGWLILMVLFNIPQTRGLLGSLIGHAPNPFVALLQFLT